MKKLNSLLKFLGILLIVAVFSLTPELIGGDLADWLKGKLGNDFYLIIGGTGLIFAILFVLWTERSELFRSKKEATSQVVSDDLLQTIREGLLESYNNRINQKLAYRYPINLQLKILPKAPQPKPTFTIIRLFERKTSRKS